MNHAITVLRKERDVLLKEYDRISYIVTFEAHGQEVKKALEILKDRISSLQDASLKLENIFNELFENEKR